VGQVVQALVVLAVVPVVALAVVLAVGLVVALAQDSHQKSTCLPV